MADSWKTAGEGLDGENDLSENLLNLIRAARGVPVRLCSWLACADVNLPVHHAAGISMDASGPAGCRPATLSPGAHVHPSVCVGGPVLSPGQLSLIRVDAAAVGVHYC